MTLKQSFMALIEGHRPYQSRRTEIQLLVRQAGYRAKFYGELFEELKRKSWMASKTCSKIVPQTSNLTIIYLLKCLELREGGNPGKTGDKDALAIAEIFAKHLERARTRL